MRLTYQLCCECLSSKLIKASKDLCTAAASAKQPLKPPRLSLKVILFLILFSFCLLSSCSRFYVKQ